MADIVYTKVDEAPELASGSFLPIIQAFTGVAGLDVGTMDISLAGRIISQFPERLKPEQQQPDDLALLGEMVMKPEANIIKLPNISASNPQIQGGGRRTRSPKVMICLTTLKSLRLTKKKQSKLNLMFVKVVP